jgi:hypothetical protein
MTDASFPDDSLFESTWMVHLAEDDNMCETCKHRHRVFECEFCYDLICANCATDNCDFTLCKICSDIAILEYSIAQELILQERIT